MLSAGMTIDAEAVAKSKAAQAARDDARYQAWIAKGCRPSPPQPQNPKAQRPKRIRRYGEALPLLKRMVIEQAGRCASCGQPLTLENSDRGECPTVDHVVPRARGGANRGNRVAMHGRCNNLKSDRMPNGCERLMLIVVNTRIPS